MPNPRKPDKLTDLRVELLRRNVSVSELARRVGVSRGHMSDILHGRRAMTERTAKDISRAIKMPLAQVMGEPEPVTA